MQFSKSKIAHQKRMLLVGSPVVCNFPKANLSHFCYPLDICHAYFKTLDHRVCSLAIMGYAHHRPVALGTQLLAGLTAALWMPKQICTELTAVKVPERITHSTINKPKYVPSLCHMLCYVSISINMSVCCFMCYHC